MKTIFVTGAGAGIGRAAAEKFAAEGWTVAATDVNPPRSEALKATIGPRHFFRVLDVGDAEAVGAVLAEFAAMHGGKLDALLNNAGIGVLEDFEATPLRQASRDGRGQRQGRDQLQPCRVSVPEGGRRREGRQHGLARLGVRRAERGDLLGHEVLRPRPDRGAEHRVGAPSASTSAT